jgi:hypothetical protein
MHGSEIWFRCASADHQIKASGIMMPMVGGGSLNPAMRVILNV